MTEFVEDQEGNHLLVPVTQEHVKCASDSTICLEEKRKSFYSIQLLGIKKKKAIVSWKYCLSGNADNYVVLAT